MKIVKGFACIPRPHPCRGESGRCPNAEMVDHLARKLVEAAAGEESPRNTYPRPNGSSLSGVSGR